MKCLLVLALVGIVGSAYAADSTQLSLERRAVFEKISFFCEIGRAPTLDSLDAAGVLPSAACRFNGPLNTAAPKLKIEPPFLNPKLTLARLVEILRAAGVLTSTDSSSARFTLSGTTFTARNVNAHDLSDPLFRYAGYPVEWGQTFVSISYSRASDLDAFRAWARSHAELSWQNPYYANELSVSPRLTGARPYLPLELQPKCEALSGTTHPSLLLVGDMHRPVDVEYFRRLFEASAFTWVALELSRDRDAELAAFFRATSVGEEDLLLARILDRDPKELFDGFKAVLRIAKARGIPVTLIDYSAPYFNFPYTNTAFHGQVIATRNSLWVERLPAQWDRNRGGIRRSRSFHFGAQRGLSEFRRRALPRRRHEID